MTGTRVRVGEVLRLERVPVEPDPTAEYVAIGVRSFGKSIFHYEPKLGDQLGSLRFFELQPDRLVVSNIKGWEGAIAVSSESDAGCLASNRFLSYVPIEQRIDVRWARWYFLSESGIELIQRASPGSADRNRTLAIDRFEALEIPLPPINEQRRVANRLDRLQGAIRGGLKPLSGSSDARLTALDVAGLHDAVSELRARTFRSSPLGDLGTWSSGGTPSAKDPMYYGGDIPWAVIGDLNDGVVLETTRGITPSGIEHSAAKVVPVGTVLVAMYGSIGKLGVAGVEMATNQAIACCQPAQEIASADYLLSVLRCIQPDLVKLGQGGAQQNISQTLLKSVIVPVPDADEQLKFASRVTQHLARQDQFCELTRRRQALTDALIPSALNEAFASVS